MALQATSRPRLLQRPGFTLLEAVFATFLLAVCLVPATYALRDAVGAPANAVTSARNLDCVGALMEQVLATPYDALYAQVNNFGPSAYPIPADPNCPARQVTLMTYGNELTKTIGPGGTSAYLVYVSVSLANPADGTPFTLSSLVAR